MIYSNEICLNQTTIWLDHSNVLNWKSFTIYSASDCKIDIGLNDMMREFLVEQENFFATKAKKEIQ